MLSTTIKTFFSFMIPPQAFALLPLTMILSASNASFNDFVSSFSLISLFCFSVYFANSFIEIGIISFISLLNAKSRISSYFLFSYISSNKHIVCSLSIKCSRHNTWRIWIRPIPFPTIPRPITTVLCS